MTALLPTTTITTAGTVTGPTMQLRDPSGLNPTMMAQATLAYGSGGTTINVYVQTSFDGGTTWCDTISFTQMTTANSRQVAAVVQASAVSAAAQDAALGAGTNNSAAFGSWWRVKVVSTGTYAGGTTLRVDAFSNVGLVPAGVGA